MLFYPGEYQFSVGNLVFASHINNNYIKKFIWQSLNNVHYEFYQLIS